MHSDLAAARSPVHNVLMAGEDVFSRNDSDEKGIDHKDEKDESGERDYSGSKPQDGAKSTTSRDHERSLETALNVSPEMLEEGAVTQVSGQRYPSTWNNIKKVLLIITCTAAMVLNVSSWTTVSISIPTIDRALGIEEDQAQWLVSGYSLASGCFLIFFGRLADLYGRKKTFLMGCAWLGFITLGCSFARSATTLFVLRGLAGMGPAAIIPAALGILAHTFPSGRVRSIAFATFSAGAPLGSAIGNQIGGILTTFASDSWRAPLLMSTGLCGLVFIGGFFSMERDAPTTEKDRRVDWIGAFLVTSSLILIMFVLGQGELAPQKWRTPYIIALLITGVFLISLFIAWQYYLEKNITLGSRPPMMSLSLWKRGEGKFAAIQLIALLGWASFEGFSFWLLLYYQDYLGLSPVLGAVRTLPMIVSGIFCNFIIAFAVNRIDFVFLVVFGSLLTGVACLLLAIIDPSAPYWAYGFPAAIVSVAGSDFTYASGTLFVSKIALPHEQSLAGGLFQTLTQVGAAFGIAISTIVHNSVLTRDLSSLGIVEPQTEVDDVAPQNIQLRAYQAAQWTTFGFAVAATLIAAIFLRGYGIVGERKFTKRDSVNLPQIEDK